MVTNKNETSKYALAGKVFVIIIMFKITVISVDCFPLKENQTVLNQNGSSG